MYIFKREWRRNLVTLFAREIRKKLVIPECFIRKETHIAQWRVKIAFTLLE